MDFVNFVDDGVANISAKVVEDKAAAEAKPAAVKAAAAALSTTTSVNANDAGSALEKLHWIHMKLDFVKTELQATSKDSECSLRQLVLLPKMQSSLRIIVENMQTYLDVIASAQLHVANGGDLTAFETDFEPQLQALLAPPSFLPNGNELGPQLQVPPSTPSPLPSIQSIEINSNNFEEEGCVTDELISRCLRAFLLIRNDVFFIDPLFCDSILLNADPLHWSQNFLRQLKSSKFDFVLAIVSLKARRGLRTNHNKGYHWIVIIGDVKRKTVFVYDPMSNDLPLSSYTDEVKIIDRFMRAWNSSSKKFTRIQCEFRTQCQDAAIDCQHCGLWTACYTMHWCLGTLGHYESVCKQAADLTALVLGFRRNLYSDLLRHGNILDTTFSNTWQSPIIFAPRSTFWNYSSLHISDYCQSIYGGTFKQIGRIKGGGLGFSSGAEPIGYTPGSRRKCFFVGDGKIVVKVCRFLWPKVSVPDLAAVLHEAAATSYICSKKGWACSVFGLVTKGDCATYVHICLCRDQLEDAKLHHSGVSEAIKDLFVSIGVVHGDGHSGNVMKKELIDFERSFLPISSCSSDEIISSIRTYAENQDARYEILDQQISKQGLDWTRAQFTTFASQCLLEPVSRQLFDFDMDFFLRLFTLKSP
jgi:hypothetical protein